MAAVEAVLAADRAAPSNGSVIAPGNALRVPSISLGTRRLCNDLPVNTNGSAADRLILDEYDRTPIACIEYRRVTIYRKPPPPKPKDPYVQDNTANLTRGIFNGYMSPATRRQVRRSVSTWIRSIMLYRAEIKKRWDPGRAYPVAFALTLPSKQVHTDREITRACLTPFIQYLKRHHGIEHYFWRAEAQENGNLHYHMIADRYIRKEDLQLAWNKAVNALGYVDRYIVTGQEIEAPSTEIHRVRTTVLDRATGQQREVDPVDYLLDYLLDCPVPMAAPGHDLNDPNAPRVLMGSYRAPDGSKHMYTTRPISGRVWGMSDSLRVIREPRAEASVRLVDALERACDRGSVRKVEKEHAVMYFGDVHGALRAAHAGLWALIKGYYMHVFAHLYPDQLPPAYQRSHPALDPTDLWIDPENFAYYYAGLDLEEESDTRWNYTLDGTYNWRNGSGIMRTSYTPLTIERHPRLIHQQPHMIPPGYHYALN